MSSWQFVEEDEVTGIRTVFSYDDASDRLNVRTESMYLQGILDRNNEARVHNQNGTWGDGKIFASVPLHIDQELDEAFAQKDWAWIKGWFNDPDHARFRTKEGTI